jgi:hypothetical protein
VVAATGRILIWQGGSLWIGRGGEPARPHAHHAIQVTLAFPGDRVKVRVPGGAWKAHDAFIVAAQQRHEFDARDQRVAQLFVEPESREGRGIAVAPSQAGNRGARPGPARVNPGPCGVPARAGMPQRSTSASTR